MQSARVRKRLAVLVSLIGMVAVGCSDGTNETATEPAEGNATDAGGADDEQVLRYSPQLFPVSLNVYENPAEEATQTAIQQSLEPLVRFEDQEAVPALAESWETPDDLTWVFELREGVEFHDGQSFTAADVKASIERFIELEGVLAPLWEPVESVEANDDHTVTIRTSEPVGPLLSTLSLLFIAPAEDVASQEYWEKPVGTGPFIIEDFVTDDRVSYTANEDYWGEAPELDRLEIVNIPEIAGRITALRNAEIDVISSIPPDQVSEVDDQSGIVYETGPSYTYYFNWFNHDQEPFDDPRVREAMGMAVPAEQIVPDLFGDMASVAQAPIPQAVFGAPQLEPGFYAYDPDAAVELLADAGYADGFETSMMWPREGGPNIRPFAQAMISAWAEIGVTVEPRELERAQFLEDGADPEAWNMRFQTNAVATGDAHFTLGRLYNCEADRLGYCNEELDAILAQAAQVVDQDERRSLYEQASEILREEAVGMFPADLSNNTAYRDNVSGYVLPPSGRPMFHGVSVSG